MVIDCETTSVPASVGTRRTFGDRKSEGRHPTADLCQTERSQPHGDRIPPGSFHLVEGEIGVV